MKFELINENTGKMELAGGAETGKLKQEKRQSKPRSHNSVLVPAI